MSDQAQQIQLHAKSQESDGNGRLVPSPFAAQLAPIEGRALLPQARRPIVIAASPVVTIPAAPTYVGLAESPLHQLADFLAAGRLFHPLCRNAFVERVQHGYYAYERWVEWRTCAVAAACAGAFGPHSVEQPEFSWSQAVWRLGRRVGCDLNKLYIAGPTGRWLPVCEELVKLTDENLWTRAGAVELLRDPRLVWRLEP